MKKYTLAINYSLCSKIFTVISGPLIVFSIAYFFTLKEQTYFYSLQIIKNLSAVFELGLANVLLIKMSYYSKEKVTYDYNNYEDETKLLLKEFFIKFSILSIILFITQIGAAYTFFLIEDISIWGYPVILLVIINFFDFFLLFFFGFIEGQKNLKLIYKLQFFKVLINYSLFFIMILFNLDLYALPLANLISLLVVYLILYKRIDLINFFGEIIIKTSFNKIPNLFEKFQLKVVIISTCGLIVYNFVSLSLIKVFGSDLTGKILMINFILSFIFSTPYVLFTIKNSLLSKLASKNKIASLNTIFKKNLKLYYFIGLTLLLLINIFFYFSSKFDNFFTDKILDYKYIFVITIIMFFSFISQPFGFYGRLFQKEPLFFISIVYTFLLLFLPLIGKIYGFEIYLAYHLTIHFFLLLILNTFIFIKFYNTRNFQK